MSEKPSSPPVGKRTAYLVSGMGNGLHSAEDLKKKTHLFERGSLGGRRDGRDSRHEVRLNEGEGKEAISQVPTRNHT